MRVLGAAAIGVLAGFCGACGPDAVATSAGGGTETDSGDATGEPDDTSASSSSATEGSSGDDESGSESGESSGSDSSGGEEQQWCVDVSWLDVSGDVHALDVDLDGRVELWTASSDWDPLTELFTTTFTAWAVDGEALAQLVEIERAGSFIAFADIDGDGRVDAIVEPEVDAAPHFLRGTASGEFDDAPVMMTGIDPREGELVDVDGDGVADFLRRVENVLEIHMGDGEGAFAHTGNVMVGEDYWESVVTVVDAGWLVVTNEPFCDFCVPTTEVSVVSVDADGTPTIRARDIPGGAIGVLHVEDRDDDGRADILAEIYDEGPSTNLGWLEVDDAGSFTKEIVLDDSGIVADFDLDGSFDAIVGEAIHWGLAGGAFAEPEPLLGEASTPRVMADLDLDGRQDFVDPYGTVRMWSVQPCEGPYDPPPPPEIHEDVCGNGRVEGIEECDGSADCDDECILDASVVWSTLHDGGGFDDCGNAIAIAPSGDIYVAGQVNGGDDAQELLVLALDGEGAVRWSDLYNATQGNATDVGTGVAVEPGGDIFVSGNVYDDLLWLRRYAADGTMLWTEQAGSLELEIGSGNALVLGDDGLPVIAGEAEGEAWIGKYDANGVLVWDQVHADSTMFDAIDRDAGGNLVAFGTRGYDVYDGRHPSVASYDAAGTFLWAHEGGVEVDADVLGAIALDGEALVVQHDDFSSDDEWVVRSLDDAGDPAGAFVVQTPALDDVLGIAFDPAGDVLFVGRRGGQAWIRRTYPNGEVVWERSFGDGELRDVAVDVDGSIVVAGCVEGDVLVRRFAP